MLGNIQGNSRAGFRRHPPFPSAFRDHLKPPLIKLCAFALLLKVPNKFCSVLDPDTDLIAMITITPILEGDLDDACREYLRDEFQTHRFGTRSLLFCNPERPGARPTAISKTEASNLLRGGEANETISDRERVGAWKFSFSGSQSLSVLYALAPEKYAARIENGQVETAHAALGELAGCLLDAEEQKGFMGTLLDNRDTPASPSTDDRPEAQQNRTGHLRDKMRECAFLVFSSSIATDQSPHLRTTAFLLNRSFFQAQPPRSIASAEDIRRVQAPLNEAYAGALDYFISKAIGPFKRVANIDELRIVGVPQAVVQKFLFDPSFNQPDLFDPSSRGLQRNELAAQWRAQGERFGWGPRQAEALLFALERERISSVLKDQICARFRDVERICRDAKDSAKRMLKSERSTTIERQHKSKDRDREHSN